MHIITRYMIVINQFTLTTLESPTSFLTLSLWAVPVASLMFVQLNRDSASRTAPSPRNEEQPCKKNPTPIFHMGCASAGVRPCLWKCRLKRRESKVEILGIINAWKWNAAKERQNRSWDLFKTASMHNRSIWFTGPSHAPSHSSLPYESYSSYVVVAS